MKAHYTNPLVKVFIANLLPLRWALAWFAFLFAAGLTFVVLPEGEYASLLLKSPIWILAAASFIYAAIRFYSCFVFTLVAKCISVFGSIFGMSIWGYVLISFFNNKMHGPGPDDLVFFAIILCEVWVCASTLSDRHFIDRRVH
jgi:hypothetical protein